MGAEEQYSGFITRYVLASAVRAGVPQHKLLSAAGLKPELMTDITLRVPARREDILHQEAGWRTRDEAFVLHRGAAVDPEDFDIYGFYLCSASTVLDSLQRLVWVAQLARDPYLIWLEDSGAVARVAIYPVHPGVVSPQKVEYRLISVMRLVHQVVGEKVAPVEVRYRQPPPGHADEFARMFKAPVRFNQPRDEILFDRAVLNRPGVSANPGLSKVLRLHLERYLGIPPNGIIDRVKKEIDISLATGGSGLDVIARQLGLKPRTLQYYLKDNKVTFRELLDHQRMEHAQRYLCELGLPVKEVAFRLGFTDPHSLRRAFRRWTGTTPNLYREIEISSPIGADENSESPENKNIASR